jgi:hypothetical protein
VFWDDSIGWGRLRGDFRLPSRLVFRDVFFFAGFFLTVLAGRRACLTPEDFLARLAVAVFDPVGLLFVFLFLGIAAVYHRDQPEIAPKKSVAVSHHLL